MSRPNNLRGGRHKATRDAEKTWMKEQLANGPVPSIPLKDDFEKAGFSEKAFYEMSKLLPEIIYTLRAGVGWYIDTTVGKPIPVHNTNQAILKQAAVELLKEERHKELYPPTTLEELIRSARESRKEFESGFIGQTGNGGTYTITPELAYERLAALVDDAPPEKPITPAQLRYIVKVFGPQPTGVETLSGCPYANGEPATTERLTQIAEHLSYDCTNEQIATALRVYADQHPADPALSYPEIYAVAEPFFRDWQVVFDKEGQQDSDVF